MILSPLHYIAIAFGSVGEEVNCMKKKKDEWLKGIAECVERDCIKCHKTATSEYGQSIGEGIK